MEHMDLDKILEMAKIVQNGEELSPEQKAALEQLEREAASMPLETAKAALEEESSAGEIAGGGNPGTETIARQGQKVIPAPLPDPEPVKEAEDFIIRFDVPYRFEGRTYTGIDLSGLRELRAKDIWKLNRTYRSSGNIPLLQEMDNEYTARVAARAAGLPIEFFEGMPLPEAIKVRAMVSGFFYPKD